VEYPDLENTVHLFNSGRQEGIEAGTWTRLNKAKQPCTCYTGALYLAPFPPGMMQQTIDSVALYLRALFVRELCASVPKEEYRDQLRPFGGLF
jgi:hypothetical protein